VSIVRKDEYLKLNFFREEHNEIAEFTPELKFMFNLYRQIFDKLYNWMVVVDTEGYIIMMTKSYCEFVGVTQEYAVGRHVTEIIENTRMHIVAQTEQKEIGDIQEIKGNLMVADRIPLYHNDKLVGAVGSVIFRDLSELDSYVKHVQSMEKQLEFYKTELRKALGGNYTFENIVGESQLMKRAKDLAMKVSPSKSNVLILGESGTGKELFAHAIHNASPRSQYPLIKVNCGSIPSELLESELFGYESGAFTGAKKGGKPGKFELADKSSIFLDEIGDLPLPMQVKLLRVIQEREIERIGATKSQKVDVRIIAATNRNLEEMIKQKTFREDLYYRLNVINIQIPSLRERKEDIPLLAKHLMRTISSEMERHVTDISEDAMAALSAYDWPGNIRELGNLIERALNLVDKQAAIGIEQLPRYITQSVSRNDNQSGGRIVPIRMEGSLKEITQEIEKKAIKDALEEFRGNKLRAALKLDISRTSLYEKMKVYGL
jgi:transcriptional regulator with PAS, ATPase and Fis domain